MEWKVKIYKICKNKTFTKYVKTHIIELPIKKVLLCKTKYPSKEYEPNIFWRGMRVLSSAFFFYWVLIEEENSMKNSKQTSKRAASAASAVLRDGRTSAKSKTAAGSALAQRASKKTK